MNELNDPMQDSEPVKHLRNNVNHSFNWFIVATVSSNKWKLKNMEAIYIALIRFMSMVSFYTH